MTDTFDWKHKPGAQAAFAMRVRKVNFGDGYTQRIPDGLNNVSQKWPLTFEGNAAEMLPIRDFFISHAGASSFYWTPPGGTQGLWVVEKFNMTSIGGGLYSISADFTQAFSP